MCFRFRVIIRPISIQSMWTEGPVKRIDESNQSASGRASLLQIWVGLQVRLWLLIRFLYGKTTFSGEKIWLQFKVVAII